MRSAFLTSDGQRFENKEDATAHEKELVIKDKIYELEMNEDEIAEKLKEAATRYPGYRMLLERESDWTEWPIHHIKNIRDEVFDKDIVIKRPKR